MARTAVTITPLPSNTGTAPSTTALDPTNGHSIAVGNKTRNLVIEIKNTAGSSYNATIKAGALPPSQRAGIGDLVVAVPATTGDRMITLEAARFIQADGTIWVDIQASMAGTIGAFTLSGDI